MNKINNVSKEVVFDIPGKSSCDSMPIGNGEMGVNLWSNENGTIGLLIGRTDAWDENCRLIKAGKLTIDIEDISFENSQFIQKLDVDTASIIINNKSETNDVQIKIWVDANSDVVNISITAKNKVNIKLNAHIMREANRVVSMSDKNNNNEVWSFCGQDGINEKPLVLSDKIADIKGNIIGYFHHNTESYFKKNLEHQGLDDISKNTKDPLLGRIIGFAVCGDNIVKTGLLELKSEKKLNNTKICIISNTTQNESENSFINNITKTLIEYSKIDTTINWEKHVAWWNFFWDRSNINIWGDGDAKSTSLGYKLQRYINACGGRGDFPIKFNGSIFTMDLKDYNYNFNADYRRWGGGYWFQNTRLTYWPMLECGDYDLMLPFFNMYFDALILAKKRTEEYFGHKGAYFPETMTFWGSYLNNNYGFDRRNKKKGEIQNSYIKYYFQGGIELSLIMLTYYDYTCDEKLLVEKIIPFVKEIIDFYIHHFPNRDENNKQIIYPSQSLETWHDAKNPMPDVAGLKYIIKKLLNIGHNLVNKEYIDTWNEYYKHLPEIPVLKSGIPGVSKVEEYCILPAEKYNYLANCENPELYAIFPYRLYSHIKSNEKPALKAWEKRLNKGCNGWSQDATQAAVLGLINEAKEMVVKKFKDTCSECSFPAFWGPNYDWVPDQDNGGEAMLALQNMLIQYEDDNIYLLPTWPKEWNVEFKIHAPKNTVIQGKFENGKIECLHVTPKTRLKDITICI